MLRWLRCHAICSHVGLPQTRDKLLDLRNFAHVLAQHKLSLKVPLCIASKFTKHFDFFFLFLSVTKKSGRRVERGLKWYLFKSLEKFCPLHYLVHDAVLHPWNVSVLICYFSWWMKLVQDRFGGYLGSTLLRASSTKSEQEQSLPECLLKSHNLLPRQNPKPHFANVINQPSCLLPLIPSCFLKAQLAEPRAHSVSPKFLTFLLGRCPLWESHRRKDNNELPACFSLFTYSHCPNIQLTPPYTW